MMLNRLFVCALPLLLAGARPAAAQEIYEWRDEAGVVHFGNAPPSNGAAAVAWQPVESRIFQWTDDAGLRHYGDTPPAGTAKPTEIPMEPLNDTLTGPDEYSIVRQAERMAEDRRRLAEDRILRERMRVERSRLERDKAVLRMEEQLRTRGYGPRPEAWPYTYEYDPGW